MVWLDQLLQDVRYGARTLLRSRGFAATTILTLALATGASTAIFGIVNSVLLRPLPFADPDGLVQLRGENPLTASIHPDDLEQIRARNRTFETLVGYSLTTRHLDAGRGPERLRAVVADPDFFAMLGVGAVAGRTFRRDDPLDVVVISADLWRKRFGADPSLPGRPVTLDGQPYVILGVMPETFQFPYGAASMMPAAMPESRTDMWIPSGPVLRGRIPNVTGRLRPGVAVEAAAADLDLITSSLQELRPDPARDSIDVVPLGEWVVGPVRRALLLLFAAVALVLTAACANVANIMLARVAVRTGEIATRIALGAGRFRMVRQFLVESLLLSLCGGLAGILIARWGMYVLVRLGSSRVSRAHEVSLDWRAFAFLLAACLAATVAFGLAPSLWASRSRIQSFLRDAGGHATMGRAIGRLRDCAMIMQVTLSFTLAAGAMLVMRQMDRLLEVDPGMETTNVVVLHLTPRATAGVYYEIERRVRELPGVAAAGFIQLVPLQNWGWEADFGIVGREGTDQPTAGLRYVTPGYFETMGIPVIQGRAFTLDDATDAPPAIVVNQALASRYFPGEDAVGRETDRGTIVGVVGNVRSVRLDLPASPELFYPAAQNVTMASDIGMSLLVRTRQNPEPLVDPVRAAVRAIGPGLATFDVRTMRQIVADSLWELNLYRWLVGLFAGLTLVLAAVGLYGVISYNVTARMREFAVRLTLGALPHWLAALVFRRAAWLVVTGLAFGATLTLGVLPLAAELRVGADDVPATLASATLLLVLIGLAAGIEPAARAMRVKPTQALRHE